MTDPTFGVSAPFELHSGALRLALRPDLGGSVAGLWHRDTPVLRSAEPASLTGAREAGCFALLPYSNRIGHRRFRFGGVDYTTAPNDGDSPHSLHGVAWQRAWALGEHSAVDAVLHYVHRPDAHWPFAFETVQHFDLAPDSLGVQLRITNTDERAQPVGLGWHPYFPKRARSRLHIELSDRWDNDLQQLPVRKVAQPGIDADVAHLDFDHCFDGWSGPARIRDEKFSLGLRSSLGRLVVYTPQRRDFYCVEPVSHVSNAIHMASPATHGLVVLQPGESHEASMRLDIAVI